MKRLRVFPVLLLTLLRRWTLSCCRNSRGNPAFSADFQKGLKAYQQGDYTTALKEWESLAEQGHDESQGNLGRMYHQGKGVPLNDETAVKWLKLAAEQGHDESQYYVKQIRKLTQSEKQR